MGKRLNINIGDTFGRLTVIREEEKNNGRRYFTCKCSCGNETKVIIGSLIYGYTTSCGCYHKEKITRRKSVIGNTYGRLTVISEITTSPGEKRRVMAQCSCNGGIKEYDLFSIVYGDAKSCGCYNKENAKERFTYKLIDYEEKYPTFCKVEEIRDCEYEPGIEVRCKKCNEWFKPTSKNIQKRIEAIERPKLESLSRENNFYCSDKCKQECDIFRSQTIPKSLRNVKKQSRCNQSINRKALLDLQIDECGYNYCEKCSKEFSKLDLALHHNIMVSNDHTMADDMSHQLLCCKECHEHKECK